MLVPVVSLPVVAVRALTPVKPAVRQGQADRDRGGSRREPAARFEPADRRARPSGDPAAAASSVAVLSALLDLPRGG